MATTSTQGTQAPSLHSVVAANVRAECARRGWTQKELADRLGIARITVSDKHREKTPWTLDETEKLARLFGMEAGDLLARPKGFEPLTFWLGASHTLTAWTGDVTAALQALDHRIEQGDYQRLQVFCDECGISVTDLLDADELQRAELFAEGLAQFHARTAHEGVILSDLLVDVE